MLSTLRRPDTVVVGLIQDFLRSYMQRRHFVDLVFLLSMWRLDAAVANIPDAFPKEV